MELLVDRSRKYKLRLKSVIGFLAGNGLFSFFDLGGFTIIPLNHVDCFMQGKKKSFIVHCYRYVFLRPKRVNLEGHRFCRKSALLGGVSLSGHRFTQLVVVAAKEEL